MNSSYSLIQLSPEMAMQMKYLIDEKLGDMRTIVNRYQDVFGGIIQNPRTSGSVVHHMRNEMSELLLTFNRVSISAVNLSELLWEHVRLAAENNAAHSQVFTSTGVSATPAQ